MNIQSIEDPEVQAQLEQQDDDDSYEIEERPLDDDEIYDDDESDEIPVIVESDEPFTAD